MTKRKSSRSIFSRNKQVSSLRAPRSEEGGQEGKKKASSIFVSKPLYGKRAASPTSSGTASVAAPPPKTEPLSETERDNLMRTFLRDRQKWGASTGKSDGPKLSIDEMLERAKGGLFKNMSDETLREYVNTGKRRKALVRYVFIQSSEEARTDPDFRSYQLDEADKLNGTKFKNYSTEKLIEFVDRLNDDFVSGKLDKRAQDVRKKKTGNDLLGRLKSALMKAPKAATKSQDSEEPPSRTQAVRPISRSDRLIEIYEDLYQEPRGGFISR